jgi:hypothetical protein
MKNVIIGLGNTGTQIVKLAAQSKACHGDKFFVIDSVSASVDMDNINNFNVIPIVTEEKTGSGRNRKKGRAMYNYHKTLGHFDDLYEACEDLKNPVILVSSSSGGTGSGSIVGLAKDLIEQEVDVIPIIIGPAMEDPDSYHMNTSDLLIELSEITDVDGKPGIRSYSIFRNPANSDYTGVNKAVVRAIETILGYHYDATDKDSIDDSDLGTLHKTKGRFIAVYCEAQDIPTLKKDITRAVMSGYQPAWTADDAKNITFTVGYSLSSMFAAVDVDEVFGDINEQLGHVGEKFKNVANTTNTEKCCASAIIAGLPTVKVKEVSGNFNTAGSIADGVKRCSRPSEDDPVKGDAKPVPSKRKKKSILADFGLD